MADSKKLSFSKSPILKKISRKFHRLVLGLVGLRECDGLLSEVWINTVQHSEELICNIFRRPKGEEGIANCQKIIFLFVFTN